MTVRSKEDLVYPELSYKIIGLLFKVEGELGPGHKENYYANAMEELLKKEKVNYKRELYHPLLFENKVIGKYYLDFLIDDKIVLELKKGNRFSKKNIDQVYSYLKVNNLKLGIIAQFSYDGLKFKRILNLY